MTDNKKGATPYENAPQDNQADIDLTAERERGLYLPLAWAELGRSAKPAKFRGKTKRKTKRKTRADAIRAKRNQGNVDAGLAGLIALAAVAGLLLAGVGA